MRKSQDNVQCRALPQAVTTKLEAVTEDFATFTITKANSDSHKDNSSCFPRPTYGDEKRATPNTLVLLNQQAGKESCKHGGRRARKQKR